MMFECNRIKVTVIKTQGNSFKNYAYIVENKLYKTCFLIDPSWEPEKIDNEIIKQGLELKFILHTHAHEDHINGSSYFLKKNNKLKAYVSKRENFSDLLSLEQFSEFNDNCEFQLDDMSCYSFPTPGHTFGSCCFKIGMFIFTGDTLFNEGCGSCTEIKSNPELLFNSIQFLKNHVQDNCLIFPGHSFGSDVGKTFEQVKKMNIYLGIEDKNQFVDFRMRKNQQSGFNFS